MSKKTTLDNDAYIYKKKEAKTEKEKLQDMKLKQKLAYLWEYYRLHALFFVIIVLFISYAIYSAVKPKVETSLYVAIVNNNLEDDTLDELNADIETALNLDLKKEKVFLNSSFYLNADAGYAMNYKQALITFVAASEIDIIIAPQSEFANFAQNGFFHDLTEQLPTHLYTSLAENFFISTSYEDPEKKAYGIYLSGAKYYHDNSHEGEPYILGFVLNSPNRNNSIDFIEYMFKKNTD